VIFSKFPGRAVSLLAFLPLLLNAQMAQETIPLKNWSTPRYWHASRAEKEAAAKLDSQLPQTVNAVSPDSLTFVAITPCRLVDTRGGIFNGITPFNGPSIASATPVTFPVQSSAEAIGPDANTSPAPCGTIPSTAEAYSFNITVIPVAGTANYVTLWPTGSPQPVVSTLNATQGVIVANAAIIAAGTSGSVNLYNSGPAAINVVIDMNGYFAPGTAGPIAFADFFALMPPDNVATIAPGTDVAFPLSGPTGGSSITRVSTSSFNLAAIGTYQILFQVSVNEGAQLTLTLNGVGLPDTVAGRATGTSQIVGIALITTTAVNSVLTVRNPSGNSTAITITPIAGGTLPVSAHLAITQIQ
jgi:hypothetical protein